MLAEIQGYQEGTLLHPLEAMFGPMEDFVKREVKTIRKVCMHATWRVNSLRRGGGGAFAPCALFLPVPPLSIWVGRARRVRVQHGRSVRYLPYGLELS